MSINIDEIKTEWGDLYINSGQGVQDLHAITRYKSDTEELFTPIVTDDTVIRKGTHIMTRVLQPFQKQFTPTGGATFTPQEIKLFNTKVDVSFWPDELKGSWLAFLAGLEPKERENWTISQWMATQVSEQAREDLEMLEIYNGEFAAPTEGTAGNPGTSMDGIKKIINDHIAAGRIAPVALGAVPTGAVDFVNYVEALVAGIDSRYRRSTELTIAMSVENYDLYTEGKDSKYNLNHSRADVLDTVHRFSNIKVKGVNSMNGSDKIWTTPKPNALAARRFSDQPDLRLSTQEREVRLYGDTWKGYGFIIPELVWTNDVETA